MFLGTNCYKPHSFKSTLSSETRLFSCARRELCKLHSFCSTDLADRLDTVCVCIRWAVCVFVSFQTNNKRAFRFKFSPAKQMTVSLQEKKTSKWKKDTGERERGPTGGEKISHSTIWLLLSWQPGWCWLLWATLRCRLKEQLQTQSIYPSILCELIKANRKAWQASTRSLHRILPAYRSWSPPACEKITL